MANEVRVHTSVDGNAGKELKSLKDGWETFQKKGAEGLAIGAGITASAKAFDILDSAVSKGVEVIGDAIRKGSDLRESMSLTQQVFETNTDAVATWADGAAHAFGESKTEALNFAANFGTAFKNVGQSLDETTKHAEEMTHLAADLGSAFNASSEEAATALRSGLLGESEPLRRFGVFLDEAKVKAKAAAMGMQPLNGALSDGQKVAARYALIMEQTADSQGMFGRDTSSLADTQKTLSAEVDNLEAKLGTALLPTILDVTKGLVDLTDTATRVGGTFDQIGHAADDFNNALKPVSDGLDGLAKGSHDAGVATRYFLEDLIDVATPWDTFVSHADEAKTALNSAEGATRDMGYEVDNLGGQEQGTTTATASLTGATHRLHSAYAPVITDLRTLKQKFDDATKAIEDDMFAVDDLKRSLHEGRDALKDDIDKLHELEKIKNPTRAQREDILHTKDAISDDKKQVIENSLKLLEMGKIKFPDLLKQLHLIGLNLMDDSDAARELRKLLYQVDSAAGGRAGGGGHHGGGAGGSGAHTSGTSSGSTTNHDQGKAAGGPVFPGTTYLVGEKGPELLTMGGTAGYITPNSQMGAAAPMAPQSQTIVVPIYLDGRKIAEATAAHVTKWQQDRRSFAPPR